MKQIIFSILAVAFLFSGSVSLADALGSVIGIQVTCDADGNTQPSLDGAFLLSINFTAEGGKGYFVPFSTNRGNYDLYQSGNNIVLTDRATQFSLVLGRISILPAKCEAGQSSAAIQFLPNPNISVDSMRTSEGITTVISRNQSRKSEEVFIFSGHLNP